MQFVGSPVQSATFFLEEIENNCLGWVYLSDTCLHSSRKSLLSSVLWIQSIQKGLSTMFLDKKGSKMSSGRTRTAVDTFMWFWWEFPKLGLGCCILLSFRYDKATPYIENIIFFQYSFSSAMTCQNRESCCLSWGWPGLDFQQLWTKRASSGRESWR